MEEVKATVNESEVPQLTVEQLEDIARKLVQQNSALKSQLEYKDEQIALSKLNFLFKVIEFSDKFPSYFVELATKEVINIMNCVNEIDEANSKVEE